MAVSSGYWCDRRLIVTVDGPDGSRSITLNKPFARVGCDAPAEVVLPRGIVPHRWLYLHGSAHGVFWLRLPRCSAGETDTHGWLEAGQWLACGSHRLGAQLTGAGADSKSESDWTCEGTAPPPFPVIVLSVDGQEIDRQALTRRLTVIGRHPPATMQVANRSVSNCHCALFLDAGRLWVIDLLSSNGTKLSGAPIESARLSEGETLRLGRIDLTFDGFSIDEQRAAPLPTAVAPAEAGGFRQRMAELEKRLARLEAKKAELEALREDWQREQTCREAALAQRQSELEANRAALDAKQLELEQRQSSLERDLALQKQQWDNQCIAWRQRQEAAERQLAEHRRLFDEERRAWHAEQERLAVEAVDHLLADQDVSEVAGSRLAASALPAPLETAVASALDDRTAATGVICAPVAVERPHAAPLEAATAAKGVDGDAERMDDQARIREALAAFHQRKRGGVFSSLLRLLGRSEV